MGPGPWALAHALITADLKHALIMADLNQKFNMADLNQKFSMADLNEYACYGQTINVYLLLI